jgi:beta-lactamase class A
MSRGGFDRRRFIAGGAACVALAVARAAGARQQAADALTEQRAIFQALESELGGRVGVAALNTGTGAGVEWRADERFAMCSTFKWVLAALVLSRVEAGELSLEQPLAFDESDLLEYSPETRARLGDGSMSVAELSYAAVAVSDNTAANLLLEQVGGPEGLTAFLRAHGDEVTRLDRYEPELNSNLPGDERDTTTPRAMLGTMERLLVGDALAPVSRKRLNDWLAAATTGKARLRAGLPEGWTVGDKTGTGYNGAVNDVAIAWPPGQPPILIAAYLSGSTASFDALNAAHARIGRFVAGAIGP